MFQLMLFSIFLFIRSKEKLSNYLLGIQLISQAAGIWSTFCYHNSEFFTYTYPSLIYVGYPFQFLWGPTFYLYVKSASYRDFKLRLAHIFHFLPFLVIVLFLGLTYFSLSEENKISLLRSHEYFLVSYQGTLDLFVRFQVLFYVVLSLITLHTLKEKIKERYSSISKTNYSWIKFIVIGFTSAYFLTIPFILYWRIFREYNTLINFVTILVYLIYFNLIYFRAWYQSDIFSGVEENVKYKSSKLTKVESQEWIKTLENYVKQNKPFLNPEITLNQLAESIDISPRILSQIINENYQQNFQDYINRLRVEESKKYLLDAKNKKTVLEILYEVGFNTKSAYNIAFKKTTGLTPTEYKKKYQNNV